MVLLKSSKKKEREETRKFIEHFPLASTSHPLFYLILTTFCGRYNRYPSFTDKEAGHRMLK